jgi:tyrosyl-tRNA synthetase
MHLADDLKERGLVEQSSSPAEEILSAPRTVYLGIDPTADSLHVGHLVPILLMRRLGEAGHKLVFLVGGGTGQIGDPKEKGERTMLDEHTVAANTRALKRQLKQVLGNIRFKMVDNADWLMKVKLVPFLRDIGKHFSVNDLVKRDLIKKRLATPDESISYTEFTYSLLQGFDYLFLNQKYGCDLQIGASDQWTNILSGVDLIHKKLAKTVYGLTAPLITDSTGKKFGKSEGNAVWLDPKKTTPFQFYQFWINLPDAHIEHYLRVFTFLSQAELVMLMDMHNREPAERQAQETLARVMTEIVHGPAATAQAAAATDALFGQTPFDQLSREAMQVALAEAPTVRLSSHDLENGYPLADALVVGGLASSKSDARRLIEGKAVSLSGQTIENPGQEIHLGDLSHGYALVRKGKQGVLVLARK